MRKKLDDYGVYKLLRDCNNNAYNNFYRTHIKRDGKKIYGTMFEISRPLTDEDKNIILEYPNTILYISQSQYAPELKKNCVLVLDRKIR